LTEYSDFWILDSEFSFCVLAPLRLGVKKFCPFCQTILYPKSPKINLPNSTLELGNRPLNWVENSLLPPQFNPLLISKDLPKPLKIRAKFEPPTNDKPSPTKKLKTPVELGCRPSGGSPKVIVTYCSLPKAIVGKKIKFYFRSPRRSIAKTGEIPIQKLPPSTAFHSLPQATTAIPPRGEGGNTPAPKSNILMLPHFSRHALSRLVTPCHALSRDFGDNKRLFIFLVPPNPTLAKPPMDWRAKNFSLHPPTFSTISLRA
jgi:hypothetical protein